MFKYLSANNTRKYVDVLDLLVDQYNNAIHLSIKMTPKEASRKENENKVWRNLYREFGGKTLTQKFSIGDNVRITKKNVFDNGYTQRWTEEVSKISKIQLTISVIYKITGYNGYNSRFVLWVRTSKDITKNISNWKSIKRQGYKSLVKWMGYSI